MDASFLDSLTPEERMRFASMGALQDESGAMDDQIAQARLLRGHSVAAEHHSPIGAALGSLADILNSGRANLQEQQAIQRQQGIRGEQTQGRDALMDAYVKALRQPPQPIQGATQPTPPPPTPEQPMPKSSGRDSGWNPTGNPLLAALGLGG